MYEKIHVKICEDCNIKNTPNTSHLIGRSTQIEQNMWDIIELLRGVFGGLLMSGGLFVILSQPLRLRNETPIFFKPFGNLVEQLLGAGGAISI